MKKLIVGFAFALLAVSTSSAAMSCLGGFNGTQAAGIGDTACHFVVQGTTFGNITASIVLSDTLKNTTVVNDPLYQARSLAGARLKGLDTTGLGVMPMIHLNVTPGVDTLGKPGTQVFYTLRLQRSTGFWSKGLISSGQHLFILPDSANPSGLLTYVASWDSINDTMFDVHIDRKGPLDLVFGKFSVSSAHVTLAASPDTFAFPSPKQTTFSVSGTGFRTVNPLILITSVPAGGTASKPVISSSYPVKSIVVGAGLRSLGVNLKASRFFSYYERVVAADASDTGLSTGENKPFSLTLGGAPDSATFMTAVNIASLDDSATASGTVSLPALPENISVSQWKNLGQISQISRGLEVIVTVFDGGLLSRSEVFIPSTFHESDLVPGDQQVDFQGGRWNLYTYPWDEASGGPIGRLVGDSTSITVTSDYRIMRYTGTGANQGYVNLTPDNFSDSIDLGHAFWSGKIVSGSVEPVTAGGVSQDYRPFSLPLTAGTWNDFGTPFNFPIRLQDILTSSSGSGIDTSFHIWPFNPGLGNSIAGSWGKNSKPLNWAADTLFPWMGYTVFGKSSATLKFPVRDVTRSNAIHPPLGKTTANASAWEADLQVLDKTAATGITVGKGQSSYAIEEAPSVPGQDFHAVLQSGGRRWSSIQESAAQGMSGHWPLLVTAGSGFAGVDVRVTHQSGVSEPITLVETVQGVSIPLGDSAVHLTAQALAKGDYHVVAGNSDYVQSFLQSVTGPNQLKLINTPNPFSAAGTSIQFSLPTTFSGVTYQARIFDFQGRTVWEKTWTNGGSELQTFWDGKDRSGTSVSPGQYRLFVTAQAPGKAAFRAQSNLVKLQ